MAESSPWDTSAWLLMLEPQLRAAVGERELVHLVETPTLLEVPLSPPYCRQVLVWNDTVLPAIDLAVWLRGEPVQRWQTLVGVFAYQTRPNAAPQYGALLLAAIPARIKVADEQVCDLPEKPAGWRQVAISCFKHGGQAVPVLDLPYLFSGGLLRA